MEKEEKEMLLDKNEKFLNIRLFNFVMLKTHKLKTLI